MSEFESARLSQIIWAGVARQPIKEDAILLVEAGEDHHNGAVIKLAQKLVKKKPSPGWEYQKPSGRGSSSNLRGVKFHVHEMAHTPEHMVWSFSCVYDKSSIDEGAAKGFLEKLVFVTEPLRDTPPWKEGWTLAAQASFAPTLLQRMEQAARDGRLAMINQSLEETKEIMSDNIEQMLNRGERIEDIQERADSLNGMAKVFHKGARKAKRFQMWQNAKNGMVLGTAITAGVGVVVVPPLIALL